MNNENEETLLKVENLSVDFNMYTKGLHQHKSNVISNMEIEVHKGEIVAIIGASGSGKSVLAHSILGLLPSNAEVNGNIIYKGQNLNDERRKDLVGKEIVLIPQSVTYLDPLMKIGKQVKGLKYTEEDVDKAFKRYSLKEMVKNMFPFQLSGGMSRRVLVSTAVISNAELIIADEPTPGLSEDIAKETMKNFQELAREGRGIILITHDIDLALMIADTVAVFKDGTTVEVTSVENFKKGGDALKHPFSRALHRALPQNDFEA